MPSLAQSWKFCSMRALLLSVLLISLTGCGFIGFPGVYRINIEQGNIVTQEDVDKLERGMTRRQVRFILGTPLIEDSFDRNRWDYHYEIKRGGTLLTMRELTVYFDGDRLDSVVGDIRPEWAGGGETSGDDKERAADTGSDLNDPVD